ncbi:hypothetical protein EWH99_09870 [Sporolactobacillus sp. THM7-7]|nr:hypothetical protein EWH99_09870 [Sporolactobacillus sp. THM7-7]
MTMNKKVTVTLALTVGLTYTSVAPSFTYAETSLSKIKNETAEQQSLQTELSEKQKALQTELDRVNKKQLSLTGDIGDTQEGINKTKSKIESLQNEIKAIQKRIDERKELLKDRLVSMYKNGGSVNYLEVLLGSKDFGDFIDRSKALYTITTQDHNIITDQQRDQQTVKEKKVAVEKKQAENVAKMAKLQKQLAEVNELQKQRKVAMEALESKQEDISKRLGALADAADAIKKEQAAKVRDRSEAVTPVSYTPSSSTGKSEKVADSGDTNNHASAQASGNSDSGKSSKSSSNSSPSSFTMSASVSTGGIQGILNFGNKYIGRSSYVWGASDPANGHFDCSGFVNAAFAANGIRLGGNTDSLVNKGAPVSYSQAKPGDLVFFDTYKSNGHVGIYLGGGRFIGSQSSHGVEIVSMSNPYWKSVFRGVVRRVLN